MGIHNLIIHHIDFKTTFLNDNLEDKFYMKESETIVMSSIEHKMCKLVKSLYWLK